MSLDSSLKAFSSAYSLGLGQKSARPHWGPGINDLLFNAFLTGRRSILSPHVEREPFYIVVGAGLRDCAGLPGNRVYIQPNNRTSSKLKEAYPDDVFPHTIGELAHALQAYRPNKATFLKFSI